MNTDKIYAEKIASEYAPREASKVVALKKLDAKAKRGANIFAYTFGIVSTLVFGTGMCLCLGELGSGVTAMALGVALGLVGIVGVSVNYFIYQKLLQKGKMKYGNDIIKLAKEISEE